MDSLSYAVLSMSRSDVERSGVSEVPANASAAKLGKGIRESVQSTRVRRVSSNSRLSPFDSCRPRHTPLPFQPGQRLTYSVFISYIVKPADVTNSRNASIPRKARCAVIYCFTALSLFIITSSSFPYLHSPDTYSLAFLQFYGIIQPNGYYCKAAKAPQEGHG